MCTSIIVMGNGAEALLTSSIPRRRKEPNEMGSNMVRWDKTNERQEEIVLSYNFICCLD